MKATKKPRYESAGLFFLFLLFFNAAYSQTDAAMVLTQADLYFKSANYTGAVSKYSIALKQLSANSPQYLKAVNQLGLSHYYLNQFEEAIKVYSKTVGTTYKKIYDSDKLYADLLNNLAAAYTESYQLIQAENTYKVAMEAKKFHYGEVSTQHAISVNNYAELLLLTGRYSEAEKYLKEAMQWLTKAGDASSNTYAKCLNNLAEMQLNMGLYSTALQLFTFTIDKKTKAQVVDAASLAIAWINAGNCYYYLEKYTEAENHITKGLQILVENQLTHTNHYPTGLSNLGEVYVKTKQLEKAKKVIEKSLSLYIENGGDNTADYFVEIATYAYVLQLENQTDKAIELYEKSMKFFADKGQHTGAEYTAIGLKLAFLWLKKREYTKADALATQCLKARKSDINGKFMLMTEKEKCAYVAKNRYFIENFKQYCILRITQGDAESQKVFAGHLANFQLHFKSIVLSSVYSLKAKVAKTKDTTLAATYRNWENLKLQVPVLVQNTAKKDELVAKTAKIDALEKNILEKLAQYATTHTDNRTNWEQIKTALQPQECAIDIIRVAGAGATRYAALWFTANSATPTFVWLADSTLEKRGIKYYRNSILHKQEDELSYHSFWADIQKSLPMDVKKIYICLDGVYNQLNINTLKNPTSKKYIIEQYDIAQVTNLSDIVLQKATKQKGLTKNFLLIGRPEYALKNTASQSNDAERSQNLRALNEQGIPYTDLPGTEKEVRAIDSLLKSKNVPSKLVTGIKATEEFFRGETLNGVVHIATHGYFIPLKSSQNNSESLLRSGIVLADVDMNKPYDGLLTAYETTNLDMSETDILVLSACETGLGEVVNGEGVMGLQRAAKMAGAKSVLMSLWTVNDEATFELMAEFYKQWLTHLDKRKAMREAQILLMKKYPKPYYWGAFVLLGD